MVLFRAWWIILTNSPVSRYFIKATAPVVCAITLRAFEGGGWGFKPFYSYFYGCLYTALSKSWESLNDRVPSAEWWSCFPPVTSHSLKFVSVLSERILWAGNGGEVESEWDSSRLLYLTGVQCEKGLVHGGWQCLTVVGLFCGKHPPGKKTTSSHFGSFKRWSLN